MKDLMNLIKQRRKIYMLMLIGTVLFTLYTSFLNVNVLTFRSFDESMKEGFTQELLAQYLENGASELTLGYCNGELIDSCFFGAIPEFIVICFMMIVLMIIFFRLEGEKKQTEFVEMLPCKRIVKEMSYFLPLLFILLINCTVGVGSTLIQLCAKNKAIIELENKFPELLQGKISETLIVDSGIDFLRDAAVVVLLLVIVFVFYYLFSLIFKSRSIGVMAGGLVNIFWGSYVWGMADLLGLLKYESIYQAIDIFVENPLNVYYGEMATFNFPFLFMSFAYLAIMILGIALICKYTEHSIGKICRFKWMEVILLIHVGGVAACLVLYVFDVIVISLDGIIAYNTVFEVFRWIAIAIGVLVNIIIFRAMYKKHLGVIKVEVRKKTKNHKYNDVLKSKGYWIVLMSATIASLVAQFNVFYEVRYFFENEFTVFKGALPVESIINEFDLLINKVNYDEQKVILGIILVFLIGYKCIDMYVTGKKTAVHFLETLPVRRNKRLLIDLFKNLMLAFVPFTSSVLCILGHLLVVKTSIGSVAWSVLPQVLGWYLFGISVLFVTIGCMFLIDTVVANRNMKLFCLICIASFSGILAVLADSVLASLNLVDDSEHSYIIRAIVLLAAGVVMLIMTFVLNVKRDHSVDKFYYKFAAYGFALIVAVQFVAIMFLSYSEMKIYVFIPILLVGTVSLFLLTANWCVPEVHALLAKKGKKKDATR